MIQQACASSDHATFSGSTISRASIPQCPAYPCCSVEPSFSWSNCLPRGCADSNCCTWKDSYTTGFKRFLALTGAGKDRKDGPDHSGSSSVHENLFISQSMYTWL